MTGKTPSPHRRAGGALRRLRLRPARRGCPPRERRSEAAALSANDVTATELADPYRREAGARPGNDAPIGGLKVTTDCVWFAARPSGTEDVQDHAEPSGLSTWPSPEAAKLCSSPTERLTRFTVRPLRAGCDRGRCRWSIGRASSVMTGTHDSACRRSPIPLGEPVGQPAGDIRQRFSLWTSHRQQ